MSLPLDGSSLLSGSAFPVFEGPVLWWRLLKQRRNWKGLHVPVASWCYNIFAKQWALCLSLLVRNKPFFFKKKKLFSCLSFLLVLDFILTDRYLVVCACCFLIILLIVFVFGRAGSWLLRRLSSRCSELWLLSIWGARASCGDFSCCRAQALRCAGLSSCGSLAPAQIQ